MSGLEWPAVEKAYVAVDNARDNFLRAQQEFKQANADAYLAHDRWIRQTAWRRSVGLLEPEGSIQRLY